MDLLRVRGERRRRWRARHRRRTEPVGWLWRRRDKGHQVANGNGTGAAQGLQLQDTAELAVTRSARAVSGAVGGEAGHNTTLMLARHRRVTRLMAMTLAVVMLAVAAALLVALGSYRHYPVAAVLPPEPEQQENAIWLGYRWFSGNFSDTDLLQLVERVQYHRFGYLLIHAGALDASGKLADPQGEGLGRLLGALRLAGYQGKVLAWVGGKNADFGPGLDLENAAVRQEITQTVASLMVGNFLDGVHLDIQPIRSGDPFFLTLLGEIRAKGLLPGQVLSVAVRPLRPGWIPGVLRSDLYTTDYLRAVASQVDQLAVLTYDSALPLPGLYQRWLERQVDQVVAVVAEGVRERQEDSGRDRGGFSLLFTVPSFEEPRFNHWPVAENVATASQALVASFAWLRGKGELPPQLKMGYSLYAEWTTDETEWRALGHLWS